MSSKSEERKLTLPSGHPEAGYLSPDLSGTDGVTTIPPEPEPEERDKRTKEERDKATADANQAVLDHEDEVARKEAAEAEAEAKKRDKAAEEQPAAKAVPRASSSS